MSIFEESKIQSQWDKKTFFSKFEFELDKILKHEVPQNSKLDSENNILKNYQIVTTVLFQLVCVYSFQKLGLNSDYK